MNITKMKKKLKVVILGILGRTPFAGVAWQVLHYLEGFHRLGCDVYYVEDTGDWPYDAERNTVTDDCSFTVNYIDRHMAWCGLPNRWAYRSGVDGHIYGMSNLCVLELFDNADVLINLTGATILRDEHLRVPVRIYLETDPVLPQIEVAKDHRFTIDILRAHTHLFTFGENLGASDCGIPLSSFVYHSTRQPVVIDWWDTNSISSLPVVAPNLERFRTISSWEQAGKDIEWNGETYLWSKHLEFLKFIDLPTRTNQPLELALAIDFEKEREGIIKLLSSYGWRVVDAILLSKDIIPYRDYIVDSRGEFTVAKDQYVRLRSGWFSDRSACFLASSRPVITQDTGFDKFIPTGLGLYGFRSMGEILDAFDHINSNYEANAKAAREIAEEYFSAEHVLADLLLKAGL